jgi:endoribonuclease Dicer
MFFPWPDLEIPWSNIQTRYTATFDNLGPYGAELYLYNDMKRRVAVMIDESLSDTQKTGFLDEDQAQEITPTATDHLARSLLEIEEILSEFQLFFEDDSVPTNISITLGLEWCSPKVQALVEVLVEHHSPTFQGIVFVEQRQVAACLAQILLRIPQLKDLIKCAELIGKGNRDDGPSRRMWSASQHDAVKLFREKKINLRESFQHIFLFD